MKTSKSQVHSSKLKSPTTINWKKLDVLSAISTCEKYEFKYIPSKLFRATCLLPLTYLLSLETNSTVKKLIIVNQIFNDIYNVQIIHPCNQDCFQFIQTYMCTQATLGRSINMASSTIAKHFNEHLNHNDILIDMFNTGNYVHCSKFRTIQPFSFDRSNSPCTLIINEVKSCEQYIKLFPITKVHILKSAISANNLQVVSYLCTILTDHELSDVWNANLEMLNTLYNLHPTVLIRTMYLTKITDLETAKWICRTFPNVNSMSTYEYDYKCVSAFNVLLRDLRSVKILIDIGTFIHEDVFMFATQVPNYLYLIEYMVDEKQIPLPQAVLHNAVNNNNLEVIQYALLNNILFTEPIHITIDISPEIAAFSIDNGCEFYIYDGEVHHLIHAINCGAMDISVEFATTEVVNFNDEDHLSALYLCYNNLIDFKTLQLCQCSTKIKQILSQFGNKRHKKH
jgi:hypothetical protein